MSVTDEQKPEKPLATEVLRHKDALMAAVRERLKGIEGAEHVIRKMKEMAQEDVERVTKGMEIIDRAIEKEGMEGFDSEEEIKVKTGSILEAVKKAFYDFQNKLRECLSREVIPESQSTETGRISTMEIDPMGETEESDDAPEVTLSVEDEEERESISPLKEEMLVALETRVSYMKKEVRSWKKGKEGSKEDGTIRKLVVSFEAVVQSLTLLLSKDKKVQEMAKKDWPKVRKTFEEGEEKARVLLAVLNTYHERKQTMMATLEATKDTDVSAQAEWNTYRKEQEHLEGRQMVLQDLLKSMEEVSLFGFTDDVKTQEAAQAQIEGAEKKGEATLPFLEQIKGRQEVFYDEMKAYAPHTEIKAMFEPVLKAWAKVQEAHQTKLELERRLYVLDHLEASCVRALRELNKEGKTEFTEEDFKALPNTVQKILKKEAAIEGLFEEKGSCSTEEVKRILYSRFEYAVGEKMKIQKEGGLEGANTALKTANTELSASVDTTLLERERDKEKRFATTAESSEKIVRIERVIKDKKAVLDLLNGVAEGSEEEGEMPVVLQREAQEKLFQIMRRQTEQKEGDVMQDGALQAKEAERLQKEAREKEARGGPGRTITVPNYAPKSSTESGHAKPAKSWWQTSILGKTLSKIWKGVFGE